MIIQPSLLKSVYAVYTIYYVKLCALKIEQTKYMRIIDINEYIRGTRGVNHLKQAGIGKGSEVKKTYLGHVYINEL